MLGASSNVPQLHVESCQPRTSEEPKNSTHSPKPSLRNCRRDNTKSRPCAQPNILSQLGSDVRTAKQHRHLSARLQSSRRALAALCCRTGLPKPDRAVLGAEVLVHHDTAELCMKDRSGPQLQAAHRTPSANQTVLNFGWLCAVRFRNLKANWSDGAACVLRTGGCRRAQIR